MSSFIRARVFLGQGPATGLHSNTVTSLKTSSPNTPHPEVEGEGFNRRLCGDPVHLQWDALTKFHTPLGNSGPLWHPVGDGASAC